VPSRASPPPRPSRRRRRMGVPRAQGRVLLTPRSRGRGRRGRRGRPPGGCHPWPPRRPLPRAAPGAHGSPRTTVGTRTRGPVTYRSVCPTKGARLAFIERCPRGHQHERQSNLPAAVWDQPERSPACVPGRQRLERPHLAVRRRRAPGWNPRSRGFGLRRAVGQARSSGAIRSSKRLVPTEGNWTTASASSPSPAVSTTAPAPHVR
jgi:hypothetical protein